MVTPFCYIVRSAANRDSQIDPANPDLLFALREAYSYISQPLVSCVSEVDGRVNARMIYDSAHYNDLSALMRLAIKSAEEKAAKAGYIDTVYGLVTPERWNEYLAATRPAPKQATEDKTNGR